MRIAILSMTLLWLVGCGARPEVKPAEEPLNPEAKKIILLEYEKKTKELIKTTKTLNAMRETLDDQRRRLTVICADYPDHDV